MPTRVYRPLLPSSHILDKIISPQKFNQWAALFGQSKPKYLDFVGKHRALYDKYLEGTVDPEREKRSRHYVSVLNECLGKNSLQPKQNLFVLKKFSSLSLDALLPDSLGEPKRDTKGNFYYELDNLTIEAKSKKEVEKIYKNLRESYEKLAEGKPDVEEILRQRIAVLRSGGVKGIKTCIRNPTNLNKAGDRSQFFPAERTKEGKQVIEWARNRLTVDPVNLTATPSIIAFIHETEHAVNAINDPIAQRIRENCPSLTHDNKEEEYVINGVEAKILSADNSLRRSGHGGWVLTAVSPDSSQPRLRVKKLGKEGIQELLALPKYERTGSLIEKEDGTVAIRDNTGAEVIHDRGELTTLIAMSLSRNGPEPSPLNGKNANDLLDNAVLYGDTITVNFHGADIKSGELPTWINPAQQDRLANQLHPVVTVLEQEKSFFAKASQSLWGVLGNSKEAQIISETNVRGRHNISGEIVSPDEIRKHGKNPKPGCVYVKENGEDLRFHELSALTIPGNREQWIGKQVQFFYPKALSVSNKNAQKEVPQIVVGKAVQTVTTHPITVPKIMPAVAAPEIPKTLATRTDSGVSVSDPSQEKQNSSTVQATNFNENEFIKKAIERVLGNPEFTVQVAKPGTPIRGWPIKPKSSDVNASEEKIYYIQLPLDNVHQRLKDWKPEKVQILTITPPEMQAMARDPEKVSPILRTTTIQHSYTVPTEDVVKKHQQSIDQKSTKSTQATERPASPKF